MRHLNYEKLKKDQLVKIVGKKEVELAGAWKGMIPHQVAEAMRNEFVERFFGKIEYPLSGPIELKRFIAQHSLKLKSNSWLELDDRIKLAASYAQNDWEALTFWDHMRYIAYYLKSDPHIRLRRALHRLSKKKNADHANLYTMKFCQFCWRSVPVGGQASTQLFCNKHWISSNSAEYARLNRMRKKLLNNGKNAIKFYTNLVFNRIKGDGWGMIQRDGEYNFSISRYEHHKHKLVKAWKELVVTIPGIVFICTPLVEKILRYKGVNLSSVADMVERLESPTALHDERLEFFRDRYYKDLEFYFHEYYPNLARAEAWMLLESEYKHGGKRSGAGRKRKS